MKRILVSLFFLFSILGCQRQAASNRVVLKVNDYEMTKEEFEQKFKDSMYGADESPESKKAFLDNLINQKIILQDAQAQGLDKEREFLRLIQKFWEQALLKVALEKKMGEIGGYIRVSDQMIEEAYKKLAKEGKAVKPYAEMYDQIKFEITQQKEFQFLDFWISQLKGKAKITINKDILK